MMILDGGRGSSVNRTETYLALGRSAFRRGASALRHAAPLLLLACQRHPQNLITQTEDTDGPAELDSAAPWTGSAPLRINELMAKNHATIRSPTGAWSDWVELYNPLDHAVSLEGWTITAGAGAAPARDRRRRLSPALGGRRARGGGGTPPLPTERRRRRPHPHRSRWAVHRQPPLRRAAGGRLARSAARRRRRVGSPAPGHPGRLERRSGHPGRALHRAALGRARVWPPVRPLLRSTARGGPLDLLGALRRAPLDRAGPD
jgi:hypothetical protein